MDWTQIIRMAVVAVPKETLEWRMVASIATLYKLKRVGMLWLVWLICIDTQIKRIISTNKALIAWILEMETYATMDQKEHTSLLSKKDKLFKSFSIWIKEPSASKLMGKIEELHSKEINSDKESILQLWVYIQVTQLVLIIMSLN